jgi:Secretion system C-terminal sorting domain
MKKTTKITTILAFMLVLFSFVAFAQNPFFEIGSAHSFTDAQNAVIEKISNSTPIKSVHTIQLKTLAEAITDRTLIFSLPEVKDNPIATIDDISIEREGVYTLHGTFPDDQGEIVFAFDGDDILGNIEYNDRYFEIRNIEKESIILIEHDQTKVEMGSCGDVSEGDSTPFDPNTVNQQGPTTPTGCTVKVLFFATKAAKLLLPNLNPRANASISSTNAAFMASGIGGHLEKVGNVMDLPFDFVENSNGSFDPKHDIAIFNSNQQIKDLLKKFRADIFIVYTNGKYETQIGTSPTGNPINSTVLGRVGAFTDSNSPGAFIQVQENTLRCIRTFSHEAGHLFNARHFDDLSAPPGAGFEFVHNGITKQTLVHKSITSTLVNRYSNPAITFNKVPIGDATHNNASNINNRFCIVGDYQNDEIYIEWVSQPMQACSNEFLNISASVFSPPPFDYTVTWATQVNFPANFITQSTQTLVGTSFSNFNINFPANAQVLYVQVIFTNIATDQTVSKYYAITKKQCLGSEGLLSNLEKDAISIIPNPTDGHFKILLGEELKDEKRIEITDARGKLVKSFSTNDNVIEMNLEGIAYEIFFVHVFANDLHNVQKVFIVGTE